MILLVGSQCSQRAIGIYQQKCWDNTINCRACPLGAIICVLRTKGDL